MSDYIQKKGAAAFGTRLRRLSEKIDGEIREIYGIYDLRFEPRWFPIVSALSEHGPLGVGDLAGLIGVSHPAISQLRAELVKASIVTSTADPADARRQILALTPAGKRRVKSLRPLWEAIAQATAQLCSESAPDLLNQMARLESALKARTMQTRVAALHSRRESIDG